MSTRYVTVIKYKVGKCICIDTSNQSPADLEALTKYDYPGCTVISCVQMPVEQYNRENPFYQIAV